MFRQTSYTPRENNNRTIYISKSLIVKFDQEPNKSGLVNVLLKQYYKEKEILSNIKDL